MFSVPTLTTSTITTVSGDLSIVPVGNVNFNTKNLYNCNEVVIASSVYSNPAMDIRQTGDASVRLMVDCDGQHGFGDGTNARDTWLFRDTVASITLSTTSRGTADGTFKTGTLSITTIQNPTALTLMSVGNSSGFSFNRSGASLVMDSYNGAQTYHSWTMNSNGEFGWGAGTTDVDLFGYRDSASSFTFSQTSLGVPNAILKCGALTSNSVTSQTSQNLLLTGSSGNIDCNGGNIINATSIGSKANFTVSSGGTNDLTLQSGSGNINCSNTTLTNVGVIDVATLNVTTIQSTNIGASLTMTGANSFVNTTAVLTPEVSTPYLHSAGTSDLQIVAGTGIINASSSNLTIKNVSSTKLQATPGTSTGTYNTALLGVYRSQVVVVSNTNSTTTCYTVNIPANTLAANGDYLDVYVMGGTASTSDTKSVAIVIGGVTISEALQTNSSSIFELRARLFYGSATNMYYALTLVHGPNCSTDGTVSGVTLSGSGFAAVSTLTITTTNNSPLTTGVIITGACTVTASTA